MGLGQGPTMRGAHFSAAWRCGLAIALACAGQSGSDSRLSELVGGWVNDANQRACFAEDRRMWVGDAPTELTGPSYCRVSADGAAFSCTDPDDDSHFDGSIEIDGDDLELTIADCLAEPAECRVAYRRDASVTCG